MAEPQKKQSKWVTIALVLVALIVIIGIPVAMIFLLGIPWQVVALMGFMLVGGIIVFLVAVAMLNSSKFPDMSKRNKTKIAESALLSIPEAMYGRALWTNTGAYLGKVVGFSMLTEVVDPRKLEEMKQGKKLSPEDEHLFYVFRTTLAKGILANIFPWLSQDLLIRVRPELIEDLTTPDIILLCDTVKRLDQYFLTPVVNNKQEREELVGIEGENYRELVSHTLSMLGETTEKAMKSSPKHIEKKDEREGGFGTKISKAISGNRDE